MTTVYTAIRKEYPRTWRIWYRMNKRCDANDPQDGYATVKVCDDWSIDISGEQGFLNFFDDMGPCEDTTLSIDRINTLGDYEETNCRWATRTQQANNTVFHAVTERGQMVNKAVKNGIPKKTYYQRCSRGWHPEDAASIPVRKGNRYRKHLC